MQITRRTFAALGTLALLAAVPFSSAEDAAAPHPPAAKPKVTISKETTFITKPLRPDGYPDYVAAMNELMSQGVTPENNAFVPLIKALGPGEVKPELRAEFFKKLGMAELPEQGDYFVDEFEMVRRWEEGQLPGGPELDVNTLHEQFEVAQTRPWSAKEFPIVADWLKLNEEPLKLVAEAVKRPKYYQPQVGEEDKQCALMEGLSMIALESRYLIDALKTRSMLKLQEGATAGAMADLQTINHLVRRFSAEPYLIGYLITASFDTQQAQATCAFLHYAKTTPEQRAAIRADTRAVASSPRLVDALEPTERYFTLDAICFAARNGADKLSLYTENNIFLEENDKLPEALREACKKTDIDWNVVLKEMNRWHERFVTMCKIENSAERLQAFEKFEKELSNLKTTTVQAVVTTPDADLQEKPNLSLQIAHLVVCAGYPALVNLHHVETRRAMLPEMVQLLGALASYRADKNQYPEKLDDLVPKHLAAIPKDRFAADDRPVKYRREDEGYVLWSVHMNGIDDDGIDDYAGEPSRDDLVLRPLPKVKAAK